MARYAPKVGGWVIAAGQPIAAKISLVPRSVSTPTNARGCKTHPVDRALYPWTETEKCRQIPSQESAYRPLIPHSASLVV